MKMHVNCHAGESQLEIDLRFQGIVYQGLSCKIDGVQNADSQWTNGLVTIHSDSRYLFGY